jgi:photosystem II stability/assembly factor-like uncharacterized protein
MTAAGQRRAAGARAPDARALHQASSGNGAPGVPLSSTRAGRRRAARESQRSSAGRRARRLRLALLGGAAAAGLVLAVAVVRWPSAPTGAAPGATRPYVGGDLHSLVVDPANADRAMVGGHEGAAVTEDGGRTWQPIASLKGADPMGWAVDPRNPARMFVGGHPGFYRSEDGGRTWRKDNAGLPGTDVHGLGIDPRNPDVLYAYVMGRGLLRSADAGARWELVNDRVTVAGPILVDPRDSGTLYFSGGSGLQRSADGGATWEPVGTLPGGPASWVSQDPASPDVFYAAAGGAVQMSTDGGKTWRAGGQPPGSVSAVTVAPGDSRVVYAAGLQGTAARVYRSDDGGQTWLARG